MADRSKWPLMARTLAKLAKAEDKGLGDVIQRIAAKLGGEYYKKVFKSLMGYECGCKNRQQKLNAKYPL